MRIVLSLTDIVVCVAIMWELAIGQLRLPSRVQMEAEIRKLAIMVDMSMREPPWMLQKGDLYCFPLAMSW